MVPGVAVTVTLTANGLVRHGETNGAGTYSLPQLQPGEYRVVVERPGFKKAEASLTLSVGQTALVDMQLTIGSETEEVSVQAESSSQLDTQSSSLQYTVGTRQVEELPLNGRNAYGLAALTPGIAPGHYFGAGVSVTRGAVVAAATNNFETNGGIAGSNEVLLDGVSIIVCCQGQPAVTPTLEVLGPIQGSDFKPTGRIWTIERRHSQHRDQIRNQTGCTEMSTNFLETTPWMRPISLPREAAFIPFRTGMTIDCPIASISSAHSSADRSFCRTSTTV